MLCGVFGPLGSESDVRVALDALVLLDVHYLRTRRLPALYGGTIRYQREARGAEGLREDWCTAPVVAARGFGDCEDLACYRAAELQVRGIHARPDVIKFARVWHIVVRMPDGSVEDPSKRLGM
jgi:hypothetical protein